MFLIFCLQTFRVGSKPLIFFTHICREDLTFNLILKKTAYVSDRKRSSWHHRPFTPSVVCFFDHHFVFCWSCLSRVIGNFLLSLHFINYKNLRSRGSNLFFDLLCFECLFFPEWIDFIRGIPKDVRFFFIILHVSCATVLFSVVLWIWARNMDCKKWSLQ